MLLIITNNLPENSEEIKCIAQDPAFSPLDKEFLRLHGFETVANPAAFGAINNESLIYMICGSKCLITVIGRGMWPAAIITNTLRAPGYTLPSPSATKAKPHNEQTKSMAGDECSFPLLGDGRVFDETSGSMDMIHGCEKRLFP